LPDGRWIAYCQSNKDQIGLVLHYANGKRNGETLSFWPNGNLKHKGNYVDGYLVGASVEFYENGIKQSESSCSVTGGTVKYSSCTFVNFWDKNNLQTIKDSTGTYISFHDNGALQIKGEYIKGQRNGDWIWYYPNGKVQYTSHYNKGEEVGVWEFYSIDGKLNYKTNHENGKSKVINNN